MESELAKKARLIKLIHTAKGKLQLDDATYRDMLKAETGKTSTKDMLVWEMEKVLKRLKASGFKVRKAHVVKREPADDPQSKKIRALWLELHELGIVRDASETALAHFIKRQTGVEALQWLTTAQASHCIEALKAWKQRHS